MSGVPESGAPAQSGASACGGAPAHGGAEEHVYFQGDDRLEGMLGWPEGRRDAADGPLEVRCAGHPATVRGGVVIAHPYPAHGATMAIPVVYRVAQACRARDLASLRFNFRGVEGSSGAFSGTEEHRDVEAAAAFLRGRLAALDGAAEPGPHTRRVALAGYSFGSVMVARAAVGPGQVPALALITFPLDWEEVPPDTLERLRGFPGPVLALCAENDHLSRPDDVERALAGLGLDVTLEVVEGADHFLQGRQREVGERVAAFLSDTLGPVPPHYPGDGVRGGCRPADAARWEAADKRSDSLQNGPAGVTERSRLRR